MAAIQKRQLKYVKYLYYDKKLSASEIAGILNVSLDAVYYFMRFHRLKRRNPSEQNLIRFNNKRPSFLIKKQFTAKDKELKVLGVMLYWAEGFQSIRANIVDFANSNSDIIKLFLSFLRRICGIDEKKIRIYLYCYSNQNIENLIKFWSNLTCIPKKQFTKPYVRKDFDIKKTGKMKYGLIHIRYYDKKLLNLIKVWIQEYIKKFEN